MNRILLESQLKEKPIAFTKTNIIFPFWLFRVNSIKNIQMKTYSLYITMQRIVKTMENSKW